MRIDAWASQPHYADHIRPVLEALPEEIRGDWHRHGRDPVIVASFRDLMAVGKRPVIFMEHGSGQTYRPVGHPSYAGGRDRRNVVLFLCQSETVAAANRAAHPEIPVVVIGCPRLDPWLRATRTAEPDVVGIAFHWDAVVVPESRSAFNHYRDGLRELAKRYEVLGTAHPRIRKRIEPVYREVGINPAEVEEIYDRASVLVVDNSSVGWEFMALGGPVVWLNAPWYRRNVEHGMRFWALADSGVQCDWPADLPDAVELAQRDLPGQQRRREQAVDEVYAYTDGTSTERAVDAIMEVMAWAPTQRT